MSDLTDHVADALFMAVIQGSMSGPDSEHLATVALQAARAQGWRIVKTAPKLPAGRESEYVTEEWTGG